MAMYGEFSGWKWWFSIVILVYQRDPEGIYPLDPWFCCTPAWLEIRCDQVAWASHHDKPSHEQCSKPLLVDDCKGLYYPIYGGLQSSTRGFPINYQLTSISWNLLGIWFRKKMAGGFSRQPNPQPHVAFQFVFKAGWKIPLNGAFVWKKSPS